MNRSLLLLFVMGVIVGISGVASATAVDEHTGCNEEQYSEYTIHNETYVLCAETVTSVAGGTAPEHLLKQYGDAVSFVTVPSKSPQSYRYRGYHKPTKLHSYDLIENEYEWNTTIEGYIAARSATSDSDVIFVATAHGVVYSINKETGAVEWKQRVASRVHEASEGDEPTGYSVDLYASDSHAVVEFTLQGYHKTAVVNADGEVLQEHDQQSRITQLKEDVVVRAEDSTYRLNLETGDIEWENNDIDQDDEPVIYGGTASVRKSSIPAGTRGIAAYINGTHSNYKLFANTNKWVILDLSTGESYAAPKPTDQNMHRARSVVVTENALLVKYEEFKETRAELETRRGETGVGTGIIVSPASPQKVSLVGYSLETGNKISAITDEINSDETAKSHIAGTDFISSRGDYAYYTDSATEDELLIVNATNGHTLNVHANELLGFNNENPVLKDDNRLFSFDPASETELWETEIPQAKVNGQRAVPSLSDKDGLENSDGEMTSGYIIPKNEGLEYYTYALKNKIHVINLATGTKEAITFNQTVNNYHAYTEQDIHYVLPRNNTQMGRIEAGEIETTSLQNLPQDTIWAVSNEGHNQRALVTKDLTLTREAENVNREKQYETILRNYGHSTIPVTLYSHINQVNDSIYIQENTRQDEARTDILSLNVVQKHPPQINITTSVIDDENKAIVHITNPNDNIKITENIDWTASTNDWKKEGFKSEISPNPKQIILPATLPENTNITVNITITDGQGGVFTAQQQIKTEPIKPPTTEPNNTVNTQADKNVPGFGFQLTIIAVLLAITYTRLLK